MGQFVESYQIIKDLIPSTTRSKLRQFVLSGLSFKDSILGIEEYLNTPRIQFLYIHHSFQDELQNLDNLMNRLSVNHTFISYSEAVKLILQNAIDKPYIVISSDDGFKNNLYAAEILNKYNAKACFFINPGLLEEHNFATIKKHCQEKLHLPPIEFLNWRDVMFLKEQGHEIGGHTMFHSNIVDMNDEELYKDLKNTFEIITEKCGSAEHFAYPYGRFFHFNEKGRKAVFDSGFISCASAERGCHINGTTLLNYDKLCIRRDHVILDWKLEQILYFIARNVRKNAPNNNLFPY